MRLTKEFKKGCVGYMTDYGEKIPAELTDDEVRTVLKRLCEYENTGLTPEEIVEMKKSAVTLSEQQIHRRLEKYSIPKGIYVDNPTKISKDYSLKHINCDDLQIQRISFVNKAVKYIAKQGAFELNQGKLTVNTDKIPDKIFLIRSAITKYIERIIQACE